MKKVAIVFGASGGVGSSLSRLLAKDDWDLHCSSRQQGNLDKLAAEVKFEAHECDVLQAEAVEDFLLSFDDDSVEHLAVAHCVGSILLKPAHITTLEDWKQTLDINLTSAFNVLKAMAKLRKITSRSLVLFSSVAAQTGLKNHEAISAAKAGVEGLARSAAASYAAKKFRINVIAPGLVDTPLASKLLATEASRKISEEMHPLKEIGKPEDISSLAAWLMQPEQSWVTGSVFNIDGGMANLKV